MSSTSQAQPTSPQGGQTTPPLFYERIAWVHYAPIGGPFLFSLTLGILFLLVSTRPDFLPTSQPYWMLGLLIACSMILLQLATVRLRTMLHHLIQRHPDKDQPGFSANRCEFVILIQRLLTDRKMIYAGVFFGILNVTCGALFGTNLICPISGLYIGFFMVGFVCGMAAYGIVVVIRCIKQYVQEVELRFDDSHPDGCGGMSAIGSSIVFFATVTMIMGVLIAVYLLNTPWHNRQDHKFVELALLSWAVFPFLMSAWVLIVPMSEIHTKAVAYKEQRESQLKAVLDSLNKKLDTLDDLDSESRKAIHEQIEYTQSLRQRAHGMLTWPYSVEMKMNYTLTLIPSVGAAIMSANNILDIF